jgi:hypothetical protein
MEFRQGFCNQPLLIVPVGSPIPQVAEPLSGTSALIDIR